MDLHALGWDAVVAKERTTEVERTWLALRWGGRIASLSMRPFLRLLGAIAVLVMVLCATVWFGGRRYLARSVAKLSGDVTLVGPGAPIDIVFDARGVPQVWARSDADARFALGWLHASERLFQMELIRRMARGELSALFGPVAAELDENQRRLGFAHLNRRDIASLDVNVRREIEQYVAGVNAWIAQTPLLPPEFVILGAAPRAWTVEDVSVVGFYQSWFSLTLMDRGADYREAFAKLGGDASRLANAVQQWSAPTVPAIVGATRMTKASNSWVVAPAHSKSGAALHASDPHLQLSDAPGLWYAVGLHSAEGLNAVGVSAPGLPSISMGHNDAVSWAFTVAPIDLVDDYREIIEGAETDSPRVRTATGFAPVEVQVESITVKGAAPRIARILRTPKGPVIEMHGDTALVMHWAGYDFPAWSVTSGAGALMRMTDFASFQRVVTATGALAVNWTYADKMGNIGYQLGAPIPRRSGYDTFTPQSGTDSRAAWNGYRPLAETPFALNPAQGWLATTNSQVVGKDWPYPLPGYYNVTRTTRITALLTSATASVTSSAVTGAAPITVPGVVDAAAMTAMQLDMVSGNAVRWKALAANAAAEIGNTAVADRLRRWDSRMRTTDQMATLFAYWWERLPRELFEDELGADWPRARQLTVAALSDSAEAFADDRRTPEHESLDAIAARAMKHALAERWQRPFGEMQTLTVRHPLRSVAILDRWLGLSRGPIPSGGDDATLDAAFAVFDTVSRTLHNEAGPSMRFVLDWADVDGFTLSRHLGQSGNPLSPHFADFLAPHLAGKTWPMPFTRAKVEARAVSTLRLLPAAPIAP